MESIRNPASCERADNKAFCRIRMAANLTLVFIEGSYAVCRFDADSKPPSWFWNSKFYSLTKTEDELSLVCEQNVIPSEILSSEKSELGWSLLKVQGPLDFALTGILNTLTNPLAKAGVSLFAISTYDTDYILVKENQLLNANYAFVSAGITAKGLPDKRKPQDEKALVFEPDPMIKRMLDLQRQKVGAEETFGLVVCAGWVPSQTLQDCYTNNLLPAVQKCFRESDWKNPVSPEDDIPRVYLYPSKALHVTVATLHAFTRPKDESPPQDLLTKEWTEIVKAASARYDWPNEPLQLSLSSAQIGKRAGILLWEDSSGGMDKMRICIQAETDARREHLADVGIDPKTLSIPGIIHTSFVRFHALPETPGEEIQEKFQDLVISNITKFFPDPVAVPQVKLVCERTPYMHISDDARHVLLDLQLAR